jgi:hypothetical protein
MKKMIQGLMPTTVAGKTTVLIVASLFFVVLALGACARPASVPTPVQVPTPTGEAASAAFQIDGLSIYPAQVYPGGQVVITANVTNNGGIQGEYIGGLEINNTLEEQKRVILASGAVKTLNFSTFRFEPGTYTVALGGLKGQFEVLDQPTTAQIGSGPATSGCCQQTNSSTAKPSCCGGSGPVTPISPTRRGGCCGG